MKTTLLFVLCMFTASNTSAQTTLKFCDDVDKDGNCKGKSSDFSISSAGGTISFLLKNVQGLGTSKVVYQIFRLSEDGKEYYNNSIEQNVQPNWNYAWEEVVFYEPGTFKVKVYDTSVKGELICLGILKIFSQ